MHAAHVVAPSAICAPHMLQNAIGFLLLGESPQFQSGFAASTLRDAAAKYQKTTSEAINKAGLTWGSVSFRKVAQQREFESLTLQRLDNQHDQDHEESKGDHHRDQPDEHMAEHWYEEQHEAHDTENRYDDNTGQIDSKALERMKAHEAVLVVGLDQQKHNRG